MCKFLLLDYNITRTTHTASAVTTEKREIILLFDKQYTTEEITTVGIILFLFNDACLPNGVF